MASLDDVRRIAMALPGATESIDGHRGGATWRTKGGGFVWQRGPTKADLAALEKLGRTWPDGETVGIRTDGLDGKDELLKAMPDVLFTIPHFEGYPAMLVRLDAVDDALLEELITDSWLLKAPKTVAKEWLIQRGLAD